MTKAFKNSTANVVASVAPSVEGTGFYSVRVRKGNAFLGIREFAVEAEAVAFAKKCATEGKMCDPRR